MVSAPPTWLNMFSVIAAVLRLLFALTGKPVVTRVSSPDGEETDEASNMPVKNTMSPKRKYVPVLLPIVMDPDEAGVS